MSGWPEPARSVLRRAIERHGGWERWRRLDTVSFAFRTMRGAVPWIKGIGRSFPMPSRVRLVPHEARATFEDYPSPGRRVEFDRGAVRAFDPGGALIVEDPDRRRRFRALSRWRRWDPADAAYFFGYALTYYQCVPFLLARSEFVRYRPAIWRGCDAITVDLPADVATHCTRQTFFFDQDGLTVRHDYVVDIIGAWARGCHVWGDYDQAHGIPVARTRHVWARLLGRPTPAVALHGELDDVRVAFRDEP